MQKLDEDWLFAMGYPVSEPYWATFTVGGVERPLLVQLFERRALTYNPANKSEWQIEMGNIGQHYYTWRYGEAPVTPATPTQANTNMPPPTPVATTPAPTIEPGKTPTPGTATASPIPTPTPTTVAGPANSEHEEQNLFNLINQYRRQNNLAELHLDEQLKQAAKWHTTDMVTFNYFGHVDSKGRDYPKRLADFGYAGEPVNESIAGGGLSQETFNIWKRSPGYNSIMLNPDYKAIGLSYAYKAGTAYLHYWSTTFGGK